MKKALWKILLAYILQLLPFTSAYVNMVLALAVLYLLYIGTKDIMQCIEEEVACSHVCIWLLVAGLFISMFGFLISLSQQGQTWLWLTSILGTIIDMCFFHYLLELCVIYNRTDTYNVAYCQSRNRYYCIVMTVVIMASLAFSLYPNFIISIIVIAVSLVALIWRLRILYKIRLDTVENHPL